MITIGTQNINFLSLLTWVLSHETCRASEVLPREGRVPVVIVSEHSVQSTGPFNGVDNLATHKKDYCRQLLSGGGGQVGASGPKRCFSVAPKPKARHEASFRAPCHLKKALQVSETETASCWEKLKRTVFSPTGP